MASGMRTAGSLLTGLVLLTACASEPKLLPPPPTAKPAPQASAPRISAPENIATADDAPLAKAPAERVRATSISEGSQAIRTQQALRARPRQDAKVVATLVPGTPVTVVRTMKSDLGHWAYVTFANGEGWVSIEAFSSIR